MPSKNRSLAKNFALPELFCILQLIREHSMLQLFLQTGQARENGKTTSKSVWLTVTPRGMHLLCAVFYRSLNGRSLSAGI
jgi:hypothetical protein